MQTFWETTFANSLLNNVSSFPAALRRGHSVKNLDRSCHSCRGQRCLETKSVLPYYPIRSNIHVTMNDGFDTGLIIAV